MYSIQYAYKQSYLAKKSLYVIKVTARFFIPEFELYLKSINVVNYDCIVQHDVDRCEMIGVHVKYFKNVFNYKICTEHVEQYYKVITQHYKKLKCKKFFIEDTKRGGVNEFFSSI